MSDNTQGPQEVALEPLYSDDDINDLIKAVLIDQPNHTPRGLVRRVSYAIRDSYEAKLDEYQAVYAYYIDLAEKTEARIADLEALQADSAAAPQPASEWMPVEHELYEYPDGKRGLVYANSDGMGRPQLRYYRDADTDTPTETVIILPEHLRLCKRVAAPPPPYLYETGLTGVTMPDEVFNTIAAALYNCPGILTHRSAAQEWLKQQRPQQ